MSQIALFTQVSGWTYQDLIPDAETFDVAGRGIPYASKSALMDIKAKSQREKDQLDVLALRKLDEDPGAFD